MPLRDRAILVLDRGGQTAEFEFDTASTEREELEKEMLIGPTGGTLQTVADLAPFLGGDGVDAEELVVDAGLGSAQTTLSVDIIQRKSGNEALWGDGSRSPSDPITEDDAAGGHPHAKFQILKYWLRTTRTDSESPATLHWGEWTDGTYGSAGVFGAPAEVFVRSVSGSWQEDNPSRIEATLTVQRADATPDIIPGGDDPTPDN